MVCCCVPGCASTNADPDLKFFNVQRPDTAGCDGVKQHRLALANFILTIMAKSNRNINLNKPISPSLCICSKHFNPEDIHLRGSQRLLKTGAMPCRNLPPDTPTIIPIKQLPLMYNNNTLKMSDINHSCHIPGCSAEVLKEVRETNVQYKYRSFKMKNPKFMKSDHPHKPWQTAMHKFLMDLTDQKLADSYHRDCVNICERHFAAADVSYIQGSKNIIKKLRVGAMPSLLLPDKILDLGNNDNTKNSKSTQPKGKSAITPKTFASWSASVRKIKHKTWKISIKNGVLQCVKPSSDCCDQNEILIEIDKSFNIGLVYYGWCLPEDHFAMAFDVYQHGLVKYLNYIESLTLCEGVMTAWNVKKPEEVTDHYYTVSSKPFEYKPAVSKILLRRSLECDVLLPAPSYGTCKACTFVNTNLKKEGAAVEKRDKSSYFLTEPKEEDSSFCAQLKSELLQKTNKIKELEKKLHQTIQIAQNQMAILSQVQDQFNCKIVQLKKKTPNESSKLNQETQNMEKLLHVKLITKEEYMQPILKFAEQHKLSQTFSAFWQFQVDTLWNRMDDLAPNRVGYPKDILDICADIYMKGRPTYNLLRNLKLIKMPSDTSIKRHSLKRREEVIKMRDEELMRGGKDIVNDIPEPTACPATDEHVQEVKDASLEQEEVHSVLVGDILDPSNVEKDDVILNQELDIPSAPNHCLSNPLSDADTNVMPDEQPEGEGTKLIFAISDDSGEVTDCNGIFSTAGGKRKWSPNDLDAIVAKMSKVDENEGIYDHDLLSEEPPDIVIEVCTDDLMPNATEEEDLGWKKN